MKVKATMRLRWATHIITNCTGNGEFREWETLGHKRLQQCFLGENGEEMWKDVPEEMDGGFPPLKPGETDPPYRSRMRRP